MNNTRKKRGSGGAVALMATLIILIVCSTVLLFLPEQEKGKKTPAATPSPTPITAQEAREKEVIAVVLSVDTEMRMLRVYNVVLEEEENYVYTGATIFYDGYGVQLSAAQLKAGELFCFRIDEKEEWITTASEAVERTENKTADGVWEKTGIDYFEITEQMITFRNQNYRYSQNVCVMSNGSRTSVDALKPGVDIVTIRGLGQVIYEIVVTKGHGYITLTNHEDFVGGTITIGSTRVDSISQEASYLVREGAYTVNVSNEEYSGTERLEVKRDETVIFDVFNYGSGPIQTGWLKISVDPLGADLYIDGKKTAYTDGVELDYGIYKFEFAEGGYISYKATVEINQPNQSLSVFLIEQSSENGETTGGDNPQTGSGETTGTNTENPGEGNTGAGSENNDSGEETVLPGTDTGTQPENGGQGSANMRTSIAHLTGYTLDSAREIYILGPSGAEIYLDSEYIGTAPVSFEKIIGSYVITVIRSDGAVKNFNCTETDNGESSYYNFSWID